MIRSESAAGTKKIINDVCINVIYFEAYYFFIFILLCQLGRRVVIYPASPKTSVTWRSPMQRLVTKRLEKAVGNFLIFIQYFCFISSLLILFCNVEQLLNTIFVFQILMKLNWYNAFSEASTNKFCIHNFYFITIFNIWSDLLSFSKFMCKI